MKRLTEEAFAAESFRYNYTEPIKDQKVQFPAWKLFLLVFLPTFIGGLYLMVQIGAK